jgi:hypothetical protein
MRYLSLLIFLVIIILCGCSITHKNKQQISNNTIEIQDSSKIESPLFFNNSIRNIKDFSILVNDSQFDEIIKELSKNKDTKISLVLDTCIGDNCIACKEMYDRKRNAIIYLFKNDAGEYGYGNAQYLIINDSLKKIRNFDCSVAEDRTENSSPSFMMKEKIYVFKGDEVIISERGKKFRGDKNYILSDKNFTTRTSNLSSFIVNETEGFRIELDFVKRLSKLKK